MAATFVAACTSLAGKFLFSDIFRLRQGKKWLCADSEIGRLVPDEMLQPPYSRVRNRLQFGTLNDLDFRPTFYAY